MKKLSSILLIAIMCSFFPNFSFAAGTATLSWVAPTTNADGTPLTDLAGYKIYYGTSPRTSACPSGGYPNSINVGNVASYAISNLTDGQTYYFSVTAYDTTGNESCFSGEGIKTITPPVSFTVLKTAVAPTIDGNLSEYANASALATLTTTGGNTATIKALWDSSALYLSYNVADTQLNATVLPTAPRDGAVWNDDEIEWALDVNNDDGGSTNKNATYMKSDDYHGLINMLNAVYDSKGNDAAPASTVSSWNGTWTSAVAINGTNNNNADTDTGYTVEVKIPWTQVGLTSAPADNSNITLGLLLNDKDASASSNAMWNSTATAFENASNWTKITLSGNSVTPLTCTSWTYSAWGACQTNNTQTRTFTSPLPAGCTGGGPVLTQSCVYSGYSALKTAASPTIDGDLAEYANANPITLTTTGGNTATIKTLWDSSALYLSYNVTDTQLNASVTARDGSVWDEDGIEWALDILNDDGGSANKNGQYMKADDYHGIINILNTAYDTQGNNTTYIPSASLWNGTWTSAVAINGTNNNNADTDTGYTFEVKIPWTQVGLTSAPANDSSITLGLLINDKDSAGYSSGFWNGVSGNSFNNASNWTRITLLSTNVTPSTCTSWTYSAWGACQTNNTQTRTFTSPLPAGCAGGSPILTQSCTYDTNPPIISNIITSTTQTSATISLATNESANSFVDYGLSSSYGSQTNTINNNTSFTFTISSLSAGTTYNYRITAADPAGNSAQSVNYSFTTQPAPDNTAPAAISNLSLSQTDQTSTRLTWTAPGDDGNTGIASSYEIKYSTAVLSEANWASATQLSGEPAPIAPGSGQSMTIVGLAPNSTYYFGIKTKDEASPTPNVSGISNIAAVTTLPYEVPTCSSFYYSVWSACQPNNIQFRSVTSTIPANCTGGTPIMTQSCVYTPPACDNNGFSYSAWGECQSNYMQYRLVTSSSPANCTGGSPVIAQSCTYFRPTCTSFNYSVFGSCQPNNTQYRTVTSSSPAGCSDGTPDLTQSCSYSLTTCSAFNYSAWGTCQPNSTQYRTVTSSTPTGCSGGNPVLTQSCSYSLPTCSSFNYSAFGSCQPNSTQYRTVTSSTPTGCSGGNPDLTQSCSYSLTSCSSFNYSAFGSCQPNSMQYRTVTSSTPAGCSGGSPDLTQSCSYSLPACSSFNYSAFGSCQPNSMQYRTVTSSTPAGCSGGSPALNQSCTYTPPTCDDNGFTYSAWGVCQPNSMQFRSVTSSSPANCTGGNPALSQSCIYTITPPYCDPNLFGYSIWGDCQMNNIKIRSILSSSPFGCSGGNPVITQTCSYLSPTCDNNGFTYSAFGSCQPNNTQYRTITSSSPAGCTGGTPVMTQSCTYTPMTCSSFNYSAFGSCQPNNTQYRTVTSSSPAGCSGGNPDLTQSCSYSLTSCSSFNYSAFGSCQPNNTQYRTVTSSSPAGCSGGNPDLTQSCTYTPITCSSFNYSAFGSCQPNNTQYRTVTSSTPTGCSGGNPDLIQSCSYSLTSCSSFNYTAFGSCQPNNTQYRTVTSSSPAGCSGGNPELTQSCSYNTSTCSSFDYSSWGICQPNNKQSRTVTSSSPAGCSDGTPTLIQSCSYSLPTCSSFDYSSWGTCQPNNMQYRTVTSSSPAGCTGGTISISQSCSYDLPGAADKTPPEQPKDYKVSSANKQVTLLWINPSDPDFVRVKLLRTESQGSAEPVCAASPTDSKATVVYEGEKTEYTDINLDNSKKYCYAIFAYDKKPNYSIALAKTIKPEAGKNQINVINETENDGSCSGYANLKSLTGIKGDEFNTVLLCETTPVKNRSERVMLDQTSINIYNKLNAQSKNFSGLSDSHKYSIAYFIHYGTPTTRILGKSERGGTISSYYQAFGKLPKTEDEWSDVVKIANGRWPKEISKKAEDKAKIEFKKIYKREANTKKPQDNAAVSVMAYGLRPSKRSQNSEKKAINTFKKIYKKSPKAALDWDIVRAIAYSGAKR